MTDTQELNTLMASGQTVEAGRARLEITPIRVRELPAFARAVQPFAAEMAAGDLDFVGLLATHADAVLDAVAIGARVERAWLDGLAVDELVALAAAVLEVNADFFARRVMPGLNAAAAHLATVLAGSSSMPVSGPTA